MLNFRAPVVVQLAIQETKLICLTYQVVVAMDHPEEKEEEEVMKRMSMRDSARSMKLHSPS
jgi:hypothetical protein